MSPITVKGGTTICYKDWRKGPVVTLSHASAGMAESVWPVLEESRAMARLAAKSGDEGSSDLIVSEVIRRNELQVWFVAEHVVPLPLAQAK